MHEMKVGVKMAVGQFELCIEGNRLQIPNAVFEESKSRPITCWANPDAPNVLCFSFAGKSDICIREENEEADLVDQVTLDGDCLILPQSWCEKLGERVILFSVHIKNEIWPISEAHQVTDCLTEETLLELFEELGI